MPIPLAITLHTQKKNCWQNIIENIQVQNVSSLSPQANPSSQVRICMDRWGSQFGDHWCADCTERERERERERVCGHHHQRYNTMGTGTWTNCQCIYYIGRHTSSPDKGITGKRWAHLRQYSRGRGRLILVNALVVSRWFNSCKDVVKIIILLWFVSCKDVVKIIILFPASTKICKKQTNLFPRREKLSWNHGLQELALWMK